MLESADLSTTNQTLPQQSQHSGLAQRAAESPAPLSCAQEHASVPPTLSEHYHLLEIWEELLGTRPIISHANRPRAQQFFPDFHAERALSPAGNLGRTVGHAAY